MHANTKNTNLVLELQLTYQLRTALVIFNYQRHIKYFIDLEILK